MLRAPTEGARDFVYGVSMVQNRMASISPLRSKTEYRFEARTYFSDGSRGYDVMGFHKDQLITDILAQFERYLALVQSPEAQLLHNAPEHTPEA